MERASPNSSTEPCSTCQEVSDTILHFSSSSINKHLGSWDDFRRRTKCRCCQNIVQRLARLPSRTSFEPSCVLMLSYSMRGTFKIGRGFHCIMQGHHHKSLHLVVSENLKLHTETLKSDTKCFFPVDKQLIDMEKIRLWPLQCDETHEYCQKLPELQKIPNVTSLTVIDVNKSCLVRIKDRETYLALSYVWGRVEEALETTIENIDKLSMPGSLATREIIPRVPQTVRDAIQLTRKMGIRYLWVDRLCIIQDDPVDLAVQIRQMASIYAHSYFTIIAEGGSNANYGLRGIGGTSLPRSFEQVIFLFPDDVTMALAPQSKASFNSSVWRTRAWTFQERALSVKTLVFTENTVYWQCRSATHHETLSGESRLEAYEELAPPKLPSYALTVHPWPDLDQYFNLVKGYNSRSLTFDNDAQDAFMAIIAAMSTYFPGGFLFGIPEFLFDLGLLWSRKSPLRRRECFPSWSWLGWSGEVDLHDGYRTAWEPVLPWEERMNASSRPLNEFKKMNLESEAYLKIENSYRKYQDEDFPAYTEMPSTATSPLPKGWSAYYSEYEANYVFVHCDIPDHEFLCPFPIGEINPELSSCSWSPHLTFSANSCTLLLGDHYISRAKSDSDAQICLTLALKDSDGRWAGVLESLFTEEHQYTKGGRCELIAISAGTSYRTTHRIGGELPNFMEMGMVEELASLELYEFHNVMWVEWIAKVAYRKAIGRVWKKMWDQQAVEGIEVVLG